MKYINISFIITNVAIKNNEILKMLYNKVLHFPHLIQILFYSKRKWDISFYTVEELNPLCG